MKHSYKRFTVKRLNIFNGRNKNISSNETSQIIELSYKQVIFTNPSTFLFKTNSLETFFLQHHLALLQVERLHGYHLAPRVLLVQLTGHQTFLHGLLQGDAVAGAGLGVALAQWITSVPAKTR